MTVRNKITLYLLLTMVSVGAMAYCLFTLVGTHSHPLHLTAFCFFGLFTIALASRLGKLIDDYQIRIVELEAALDQASNAPIYVVVREEASDDDFPEESPILIER